VIQILIFLQGIFLLLAGLGRRYLAWTALVLTSVLCVFSLLVLGVFFLDWRSTVEDITVEPDRLSERIARLEHLRSEYWASEDPAGRQHLETFVAEAIAEKKRESRATLAQLAIKERTRRGNLTLSLVIALCLVASFFGYYRLYVFAKRPTTR
jgi:hypothetical protein